MNHDYKVGDRVVISMRHPVEGWLRADRYKGETARVHSANFLHRGERYYHVDTDKDNYRIGILHSMLRPLSLSPFEQSVQDYINSELSQ